MSTIESSGLIASAEQPSRSEAPKGRYASTVNNLSKMGSSLITVMVFGLALRILMPRILGVDDIAAFYQVESLGQLSFLLLTMGLSVYIKKTVKGEHQVAQEIFLPIIVFQAFLALVLFGVMIFGLNLIGYDSRIIHLVMLFSGFQIFSNVQKHILNMFLVSLGEMGFVARVDIIGKVTQVVIVCSVLLLTQDLFFVVAAFSLCHLVTVVLSLAKLRSLNLFKGSWGLGKLPKILQASVPFLLLTVVSTINGSTDVAMLSHLSTPFEVAQFGVAVKLKGACLMLVPLIGSVIMPTLAKLNGKDMDAYTDYFLRTARYVLVFCIGLTLGLGFFSKDIVHFLFGEEFMVAGIVLIALSVSVTSTYLNVLVADSISLTTNGKFFVFLSAGTAVFNAISNYFVIPLGMEWFGAGGAGLAVAFSTFSAEMINIVVLAIFVKHKSSSPSILLGLVLSIGLSLAFLMTYHSVGAISFPMKVLAFLVSYPCLVFICGLVKKPELHQGFAMAKAKLGRA